MRNCPGCHWRLPGHLRRAAQSEWLICLYERGTSHPRVVLIDLRKIPGFAGMDPIEAADTLAEIVAGSRSDGVVHECVANAPVDGTVID